MEFWKLLSKPNVGTTILYAKSTVVEPPNNKEPISKLCNRVSIFNPPETTDQASSRTSGRFKKEGGAEATANRNTTHGRRYIEG
ncbi:hypothetical protein MTR_8g040320 [Medicago truncatula]|uniref:Uncharacterized protein n=1 Tax=Medicago truncatula TaxID=3880 RepID=G7LHJ1_MEDTR|nr:hypothetical protein MTR_8g040320 [Medicago truncatula]